jgi:hypothetical protein
VAPHRCELGVVCLFRLPNLTACPWCKAELNDFDLYPRPVQHKRRGPGFAAQEQRSRAHGSNAPVRRNKNSRAPDNNSRR